LSLAPIDSDDIYNIVYYIIIECDNTIIKINNFHFNF
jgi:hypothetical protein